MALVPLLIGALVVVTTFRNLTSTIEEMPRGVVPGKSEVSLHAGEYVGYGETQSVFRGKLYTASSLELSCALVDVSRGAAVALALPSAQVSYEFGGFSGTSLFTVTVPHDGPYQLDCDGEGAPRTIAFGTGIGTAIVAIVAGAIGGMFGAIVIGFVVWRRRRRARRLLATQASGRER
jgi:hypothetical protein